MSTENPQQQGTCSGQGGSKHTFHVAQYPEHVAWYVNRTPLYRDLIKFLEYFAPNDNNINEPMHTARIQTDMGHNVCSISLMSLLMTAIGCPSNIFLKELHVDVNASVYAKRKYVCQTCAKRFRRSAVCLI